MRRALLPALMLAGLMAPAAAHAEDVYVSASSNRTASSCPIMLPCTLPAGLAAADQPGDVVHVWNGSYSLPEPTQVRSGVTMVGDSTERPVIVGELIAEPGSVQTPTRLRRLEILGGVDLDVAEAIDLIVRSSSVGVDMSGGRLHQSLVVASGASAVGVRVDRSATQVTNSTVIASGAGARGILAQVFAYQAECFYQPPDLALDVRSVIARGTAGDLVATGSASEGCSEPARITVSHSNFRTAHAAAQTASIVQGAGNQTTTELTDLAAIVAETSTYRQRSGAPTRNAGSADPPPPAPTDLDGQARVQESGIDIGADELPAPPRAATDGATDVGQNGAMLQALVTPNASETHVVFDYGPTGAYGSSTGPQVLPAGAAETRVQARLEGLAAGTTFHYRVRAFNPEDAVQPQTAAGTDATFATLTPPVVVPLPPRPPAAVLTALTAKKSLKLATFRRRGLKLGFTLGRSGTAYAARLTARLRVRGRLRTVTLGKARGTAGPGSRTVTLKPSRRTVALLRRARRVEAKLVVKATPATGAPVARSKAVTLRR